MAVDPSRLYVTHGKPPCTLMHPSYPGGGRVSRKRELAKRGKLCYAVKTRVRRSFTDCLQIGCNRRGGAASVKTARMTAQNIFQEDITYEKMDRNAACRDDGSFSDGLRREKRRTGDGV